MVQGHLRLKVMMPIALDRQDKWINYPFGFGCKFVTVNGICDTDSVHQAKILAVWCCFSPIWAIFHYMRSFDYISISGLKSDVIRYKDAVVFARDTVSATFVTIMSVRVHMRSRPKCINSILPVANFSPQMNSASPISYKTRTCRM